MKFSVVSLLSIAAGVSAAALEARQAGLSIPPEVYGVLATALPADLILSAINDPNAVASHIASQFAAGQTPSWFAALPTDVQGYLIGEAQQTPSSNTAAATGSVVVSSAANSAASPTVSPAVTSSPAQAGSATTPAASGSASSGAERNSESSEAESAANETATSETAETETSTSGSASASSAATATPNAAAGVTTNAFFAAAAGFFGVIGVLAL